VNPGEVCGYLTGKSTIALLDTDRREAEIIEL
jgi:predicted phosphodiesterase